MSCHVGWDICLVKVSSRSTLLTVRRRALAKQFDDRLENNIVTELHYELGQKEGNWFDNLDKWEEY